MKFPRSSKKSKRSKSSGSDFRQLRFQSLEPRLCLDDDDDANINPVSHFNDDQAEYQGLLSGQVSNLAVQANAQVGSTGTSPAQVGQWGPLMQWPIEFISALMLPTGEVMGWDRLMNLRLWNPTTGQITIPTSPGYNIFCSGMSLLADGEVLVTGGHVDNLTGLPFASIYNPFKDTWTPLPNINAGRWYPSSTTLANGDVLILSGQTNDTGIDDPLPQVFDVTTDSWIDLDNALQSLPLYPRTFDAPNGDVFVAGPQPLSEYLQTTGGGLWIPVAERITPDRDYGSAVMYAPGKILYVGGGSPATNSAEIIDLNQPNPQWQEVSPMAFARRNCDATLLPDGEVLVTGGNTGSAQYDGDPVEAAEIWNPTTETFRTVASESDIRWYHSTALLLPSGQVLEGSGDNHLTEQVYSPPYLFEGIPQPTISSAPATVMYGDNFFVGTPNASSITDVRWIRLGTATHAENWDQYEEDATFTQTTGGLMVSALPTSNTAPPGYYMLFIMNGDVPSVASIIQVAMVPPSMSVSDISLTEAAPGTTTSATFTVSIPLATDHTITVNYSTADGTAKAGTNYVAQSGTLTFAAGVTSQTVTVAVKNDGVNDPNETFTLNLSSPVGAILGKAQGTALVRDFASVPVLDIQGVTTQAPSSGTSNANFVVTLSAPQTQPVTVLYTTMDGTATTGRDYLPQAGTLTFSPGVTQMTIAVPIVGSPLAEEHNQFYVNLSAPLGATIDAPLAEGFIYHENNAPFINIPTTATIVEPAAGQTAYLSITATLSAPSDNTVTVGWQTLMDGTAVDGKNFIGQNQGLTFLPGVTSQTIVVPILGDGVKTGNLTFSIQLQASLINGTYANSATEVTITDSDTVPGITLADAALTEGNTGTTPMVFTATLTAPANQAVNVTYTTSDGTAKAGTDYVQTTGVLTIPANTTTATFTVPVIGDVTAESDETFNVTLSNPVGVTILAGKAVGTILDDDGAPVPAAPATLTATAAFAGAVLAWQAAPNATSYSIYRGTTTNGEGTVPIATGITGTTFTDTGLVNGTTYYYRVTAVVAQNGKSYEGPASNEISVIPTSYSFPTFFTKQSYNFDTFLTSQSNLLSENGDNIENIGFYGYGLQMTDGGTNQTDSAFTLNPVNVSRFTTQFTFQQTMSYNWDVATGGGLTFTIQNAGPTVLGATGAGLGYGGIGNSVAVAFNLSDDSGNTASLTGLYTGGATPTSATATNLNGSGIDLHSGHLFDVGMTYDGTTLVVTITDTVTEAQATQSYVINIPAAVGGNMAYVGFTAGDGATTAQQTFYSWDFTPAPNAPSNLQANTTNGTQVNLSWTNNDPNATGTIIERKTGVGGTYAPIMTINSPATTTYTDNTAAPNTPYYYRVRATNNGSTSVASNEVNANTTGAVLSADLQATVTDGQTTAVDGTAIGYTIVVSNPGPNTAVGATISDTLPASATWTASATGGASGFWGGATGSINNTVTMPAGSTITYVAQTTVPLAAAGTLSNTATVTAPIGITDPNLANNTATDTDTVAPPPANPQLDLQATISDGQTLVVPGAAQTYTIVVSNSGPNTAVGAVIGDTLPTAATWTASATGDASGFWGNGTGSVNNTVTMPPGSTITYVVQTAVPAGATGTLSNTATVSTPAGATDTNPANNTATDTDTVVPAGNALTDLQITDVVGQTPVVPGTAVSYTIVVTNAGPSAVTGAVITDALPASATWTATGAAGASGFWGSAFGSINNTVNMPVGSSITYVANLVISATATGTVSNTATVTDPADVTDTNPANNVATDTETLAPPPANPQADLQITVDDGQTSVVPGEALTYTIVANNTGPNTITGAVIADTFPAALTNVSWTVTAAGDAGGFWPAAGGSINQPVTMPPESTITYTVSATVAAGATGTVVNTATITPPPQSTDTNPANNSATDTDLLGPPADLQITLNDGQTSAVPGSPITYTIVVTNAGPNAATGAAVADAFPSTLTGVTYTATATGGATGFAQSGTGNISNTVNMPSGSTVTYTAKATVSPAATGALSDTATVTPPTNVSDPNLANNTATDTDTLPASTTDLQLTITDGQTTATPGSPLAYTVVVTNAGPSAVTGAIVTDALPTALTGVSYTATATGGATGFPASATGNINNTVNMPVGSTVTYIVSATLNPATTGTLANTASVATPAGMTDSNPANNSAIDTDTLAPQADLQITDTDGQTSATPGTAIVYTVVVTNAGPSTATGATITDTLPATLTGATFTANTAGGATGYSASGIGNISNTVTMPPGSTITYVVTGTVSPAATGTLANTAGVIAPAGTTDPNAANNSATDSDTLTPQADLQITNTDGQTSATPGTAVAYTIVVTNAGPSNVTGATVTETLPATLTGATYTATATGGATGYSASGTGNLSNTVTMPSGSTITYVVSGTISSAATGSLATTASVAAPAGTTDPTAANNSATDSDTLTPRADLQITNTDGQTSVAPGAAVAYTIVVTNAGPSSVTGATVTDTLPATLTGATYTATATGGATGYTASGTGNLSNTVTMPTGSTITYVVHGTLSSSATGSLANTASVAAPAGTTDPTTTNNSATDTDTITAGATADLQITNTDGQTSATPGTAVAYTIVVTNAGPSNVTGATVTETLPATLTGATYTATATGGATGYTASGTGNLSNTVTMPTGSTITYVVNGTISSAATGTLATTASVAAPAGTTDPNAANNSATDSDTLAPRADLQITNTDGQTSATPGTAVAYTIVVTNAGPSNVPGATVTDTLPATLTGATYTATATGGATGYTASGTGNLSNTVTMPTGSTITYIVNGTISSAATGTLATTASVAAPAGTTDPNAANNSATDSDTLTPRADLQITNTDGQTTVAPGAAVAYTIVVTNAGPSNVTGATVADTLPATLTGTTYTATATGGATGYTASGTGNLSNTVTMPTGSTITYVVHGTLSSSATGSLANTASVAAPAGTTDPTTTNNSATDTDTITTGPTADLQITVTDGQTTVVPGAAVTYTVVVTNAGPSTATGATITDTLPASFSNVSFTATATGGASGFWASAPVNLANTVTMPSGSTITYLVTGTLSPTATGSVSNTATVAAPAGLTDTNPANNTATDTDTVGAPQADLKLTITDGKTAVVPGAATTYTVVVTNAGPSTATNATITDTLPATFTNVSFTATATGGASGFWGSAPGNVANTVTMPPGSTITYLVTGTVSPTVTGSVSNTASVAAPAGTTDPNTTNNSATDTDTLAAPQADLQVTLSDGQTTIVPGSGASYTIVLTNAGPSNATGVVIADTLPATFSNISFTATATGGASGFWASAPVNLNNTVTMPVGSTITYVLKGTLSATATGSVADTASLTVPAGVTDPNTANNTATDTDTVVVAVASTTPASGATGVSTTSSMTVTFAAAMNAATISTTTLLLLNAQGQQITVTVTYNAATNTATIKPSAALSKNTTYTVRVTGGSAGVKDSNGNTLPANSVFSFTTGST